MSCGCLRSASDYVSLAMRAFPGNPVFAGYQDTLDEKIRSHFNAVGESSDKVTIDDYPDKGLVRRENYPWNVYEPDRFSDECLQFLNTEMGKIAPKLEVNVVELPVLTTESAEKNSASRLVKQLGVFAKEDILPGEQILEEKSLLTAVARLHDVYCNACSAKLPESREVGSSDPANQIVSCEECDEVYFCSVDCHESAQNSYHPALCGTSVDQGKVPASEAADSLYALLVVRALALAETQNSHPLELKEVRYIWGDYHGLSLDDVWRVNSEGQILDAFGAIPQSLPFSFKGNVLTPLHMLEKMEVNIFTQSPRYDTWVFNTLFAKIRGTASAQQGLDGRPEIGAVQPQWCLANHSCAANVFWKWEGSMRFWAREQPVNWVGRDPNKKAGIRKGEEVFSHYCDVRLPYKERREWAVGALGGMCTCPRCIQEAAEDTKS